MARGLSALFTVLRGSIGNLTFFSGRHHSILVRDRIAPVQPDTPAQQNIRAAMTAANAFWLSISNADRKGWVQYAKSLKHYHPVNRIQDIGRMAFLTANILREYWILEGLALIASDGSPPAPDGWLPIPNLQVVNDSPGQIGFRLRWQFNYTEDMYFIAIRSPGFPITRNRYKGPWVQSSLRRSTIPAGNSTSMNFRGLVAGQAYFVCYRATTRYNPVRVSHTGIIRVIAFTSP